jgi:hypothetical protein
LLCSVQLAWSLRVSLTHDNESMKESRLRHESLLKELSGQCKP